MVDFETTPSPSPPQFYLTDTSWAMLSRARQTYPDTDAVFGQMKEAIAKDLRYIGGFRVTSSGGGMHQITSTEIGCVLLPRMTLVYEAKVHYVDVLEIQVHDPLNPG